LRDPQTGKLVWKQDAGKYGEMGMAMTPDGLRIAVCVYGMSNDQIRIMSVDGGLPLSITVPE
jgi:hypothetical protein